MYRSSITDQLQILKTHEVRWQLEFEVLGQVSSAYAQQDLRS